MRRGDTRQRIQQVALELFAERGYDKTSLREVADRLGITRPALYYHFATKQDILAGVVADMAAALDELTGWAAAQPDTAEARHEILRRIAELIGGQWSQLMRFAQTNQAAMNELPVAGQIQDRMLALLSVLVRPGDDATQRFQRRLAVVAVMMANLPLAHVFGEPEAGSDPTDIALDVATRLVEGRQ